MTALLRWIDARDQRLSPNTLAKQAACAFDWPLPFAEAIVTATRARRLLTLVQANSRGGFRVGLTRRGFAWLERLGAPTQSSFE